MDQPRPFPDSPGDHAGGAAGDIRVRTALPRDGVVPLFHRRPAAATDRLRVALVGTYAPRKCGIATFTADIRQQLGRHFPDIAIDVYALDLPGSGLSYAPGVTVIAADDADAYRAAARAINESGADVVWLQHEYGIFGGPDGALVRELIDSVAAPVVATLHTVLPHPSQSQHDVLAHLLTRCSRVMVMSRHVRDLLVETYRARPEIVEIIEHGAPDRPFGHEEEAKARMGLSGKAVLTTFGLIGPGKGLEQVIEALPAIVSAHPQLVYRIVGATHPVLLAREGEGYREGLVARAEALGVSDHIVWENAFLETGELLDQLQACDIYITPYPNLGQSTSGTLSYAVALGKAVISTPYVHARELLADGVGRLIPDNSPASIAAAINALLDSPEELLATRRRAWERGRRTIWSEFARASARMLRHAAAPAPRMVAAEAIPGLTGLRTMTDGTGMYQHAIGIVPDRRHGYCLDDNVRALMLMNVAAGVRDDERTQLSACYAGFIAYAWNPDVGRFRNFMRFDRSWPEEIGSEDSNGRALWALGHTVERSPLPDIAEWALALFDQVAPHIAGQRSLRALGFAALGSLAVLRAGVERPVARDIVEHACATLTALFERMRRPDWVWFEAVLGYDNPRLCQVLIEAGTLFGRQDWLDAGVATLGWLSACQTGAAGHFRPIGSETFGRPYAWQPFDQQPLEAQAAIEAARGAWIATRDAQWIGLANRAYRWFFGANDRGVVLADIASGRCRDGVTPRGRNENCGAESILAFQLGHYGLAELMRAAGVQPGTALQAGSAVAVPGAPQKSRGGTGLGYPDTHLRQQSAAHP